MTTSERLRLIALDEEDLAILSAHLQDAVLKVGDMTWLGSERRFALVANRFAWEREKPRRLFSRAEHERRRTGLVFDRVTAVRSLGFDHRAKDAVLVLLAIRFEATDAPAGTITLVFAGEATVQLDVECIEARMDDLGPAWATAHRPLHGTP